MLTAWREESWLERVADRPRIQILRFSEIGEHESDALRQLVQLLTRYYRVISYREAVDRLSSGQVDDAYLTFSFDCGLRCGLIAAGILREFGIRACFFVPTAVIDRLPQDSMRWYFQRRLRIPPCELLSWHDIHALQRNGHEIGGQTMHYDDLARLPKYLVHQEIAMCREQLESRCGPVRHFAWPFGKWRRFSATAARLVFQCGFESCASMMRGAHWNGCQRRVMMPADELPSTAENDRLIARSSSLAAECMWTPPVCLRRHAISASAPRGFVAVELAMTALCPIPHHATWPRGWRIFDSSMMVEANDVRRDAA